jgi:hypothetical protein
VPFGSSRRVPSSFTRQHLAPGMCCMRRVHLPERYRTRPDTLHAEIARLPTPRDRGPDRFDGFGEPVRRAASAIALTAVGAAVEVDALAAEPRLLRRHGDRLLVALEARDDDAPDTLAAPVLLDYADAFGKATERLADSKVLSSAAQTPGRSMPTRHGYRLISRLRRPVPPMRWAAP